jgi:hypothetical protein
MTNNTPITMHYNINHSPVSEPGASTGSDSNRSEGLHAGSMQKLQIVPLVLETSPMAKACQPCCTKPERTLCRGLPDYRWDSWPPEETSCSYWMGCQRRVYRDIATKHTRRRRRNARQHRRRSRSRSGPTRCTLWFRCTDDHMHRPWRAVCWSL